MHSIRLEPAFRAGVEERAAGDVETERDFVSCLDLDIAAAPESYRHTSHLRPSQGFRSHRFNDFDFGLCPEGHGLRVIADKNMLGTDAKYGLGGLGRRGRYIFIVANRNDGAVIRGEGGAF